jgi:hypothetical protein
MVEPGQLANDEHTIFDSGNHTEAKSGPRHSHPVVRVEVPLWVRLYGTLGNPIFNIRVLK